MPVFDPKKSSSYSNVSCSNKLCKALPISSCNDGCEYEYLYGGGGFTVGFLATETFTFENLSVPKIGFGCGKSNGDEGLRLSAGLVGLGRGPLSLVSQLGITIGSTRLPINKTTFALNPDGSGGLIIDSGTTFTYLGGSAYILVREEFVSQVKLPVVDGHKYSTGLDLCFKLRSDAASSVEMPALVFHVTDADLHLPTETYMLKNSSMGVVCLAMGGSIFGLSIFGNVQQQNYLVDFHLSKETLSFMPTECDKF
ncbi:hypothetical protein RHMOL_Rhmol02G0268000 [Rhododendron molle]|uniref:Uncharacterized protein n=1 Tax=Rhododendron molle TaxID=49168 RepID=A0ACC0PUZ5_RHOML|nr:hypothetical protein RHMOL_Rhmol02G0268000 [Rhododendron molle]